MAETTKSLAESCHDNVSLHITDLWDAVALIDSALARVREHASGDKGLVSLLRMASERLHELDDVISSSV